MEMQLNGNALNTSAGPVKNQHQDVLFYWKKTPMSPVASITINSTQYLVQIFSQTAVLCILLGNNLSELFGKVLIASESVK